MKNHANVTNVTNVTNVPNVTNAGDRGRRKPERGSKAADLLGQSSPQENQGLFDIFSIFKVPSSFSSKSKQRGNRLLQSLKLDDLAPRCLFSTKPRPPSISRPTTSCKPPSGMSSHCYFISIIMNYWLESTAFTNVSPFPVKITRRDSNPT